MPNDLESQPFATDQSSQQNISQFDESNDTANVTEFRNMYIPSINFPEEETDNKSGHHHSRKAYQRVDLDDENAARFGDTTRVGWKGRVDYAVNAYDTQRRKAEATGHEIKRDPNALLNVTITTVILLASGIYDIPMEYYLYTELYLASVKDEFNDRPPNIEELVKHIRFIRQSNDISWKPQLLEEPAPGLIVSKIRNRSRIPLSMHSRSQRTGHSKTFATTTAQSVRDGDETPAEKSKE